MPRTNPHLKRGHRGRSRAGNEQHAQRVPGRQTTAQVAVPSLINKNCRRVLATLGGLAKAPKDFVVPAFPIPIPMQSLRIHVHFSSALKADAGDCVDNQAIFIFGNFDN